MATNKKRQIKFAKTLVASAATLDKHVIGRVAVPTKAPDKVRIAELFYWIASISGGLAAGRHGRMLRAAAVQARLFRARLRACETVDGLLALREELNSGQFAADAMADSPRRSPGSRETKRGAMERSLSGGRTPGVTICEWVNLAEAQGIPLTEWRWSDNPQATLIDKLAEAADEIGATCQPFDQVSPGPVHVAGDVGAVSHYSAIQKILNEIIRLSEAGEFEELGTWLSSINLGSISAGIEWEAAQVPTESQNPEDAQWPPRTHPSVSWPQLGQMEQEQVRVLLRAGKGAVLEVSKIARGARGADKPNRHDKAAARALDDRGLTKKVGRTGRQLIALPMAMPKQA